jgi:PadR family transcriptional regulator, regulatory protein PadR
MAKNDLQGALDLLILKTLSHLDSMHGYGIMMHIRRVTDELLIVEEGSLYPALHRMEEAGWIRAQWITRPGPDKDSGRRARIYELTAAGMKRLEDEESQWRAVTSAVNRVLRTV